jgi:hypothetical protein
MGDNFVIHGIRMGFANAFVRRASEVLPKKVLPSSYAR